MTDAAASSWEDDIVAALLSLTPDDVPALEIVVIDAVVDWLVSPANPAIDYGPEHAGHLISSLFTALDTARTFTPEIEPPITDDIAADVAAARARVVEGAHEIAAARSDGIALLVSRLMPSVLAELSANVNERGKQAHGVAVYLLYALAVGTRTEQEPAVLNGLGAVFAGWDTVLRNGYRVPWRPSPAATD